jgi:arylsulfatase A-like enzyme
MGDAQVADWAIEQLGRTHEKPFFLACGFFRPHLPWYVPKRYFDLYPLETVTLPNVKEDDLDDVPPAGRAMAKPTGDHARVLEHGAWRRAVQGYLASISFVDACVGRVVRALDDGPHKDTTVIVLWSDHGWHLGEKLHWRKFALWEEATHNVLFFAAPGVTPEERRCDAPVSLLDVYPTLLDLCRVGPREELEGHSLLPLLQEPDREWPHPALTTHGRNNHTLRTRRWRYIRYADGAEELYDHDADAMEWDNLADDPDYRDIKRKLKKSLPAVNAENSPGRSPRKAKKRDT